MARDSCREQASSLDTENMSDVIRNTKCRIKDSTGNDYSSFLTKSATWKSFQMRKLASEWKLIEEVMIIFKGLTQNAQTVFVYFPFYMKLPEKIPRKAMKLLSNFKLGTNMSSSILSEISNGKLPSKSIFRWLSLDFWKQESVTLSDKQTKNLHVKILIKWWICWLIGSHTY